MLCRGGPLTVTSPCGSRTRLIAPLTAGLVAWKVRPEAEPEDQDEATADGRVRRTLPGDHLRDGGAWRQEPEELRRSTLSAPARTIGAHRPGAGPRTGAGCPTDGRPGCRRTDVVGPARSPADGVPICRQGRCRDRRPPPTRELRSWAACWRDSPPGRVRRSRGRPVVRRCARRSGCGVEPGNTTCR